MEKRGEGTKLAIRAEGKQACPGGGVGLLAAVTSPWRVRVVHVRSGHYVCVLSSGRHPAAHRLVLQLSKDAQRKDGSSKQLRVHLLTPMCLGQFTPWQWDVGLRPALGRPLLWPPPLVSGQQGPVTSADLQVLNS